MDVRRDTKISRLEAALRRCAVAAAGMRRHEMIAAFEQIKPEDVPEYINDRFAELECKVAQQEEEIFRLNCALKIPRPA